jgi:8-oxo-dGDP phosphatase
LPTRDGFGIVTGADQPDRGDTGPTTAASTAWFEVRDSRVVYDGWSTVRVDTVAMPDGSVVDREIVQHVSAVAVVPLYADGTIVLLRQFRQPVGGHLLEIPAGILDVDGESLEDAAQREMAEEVGLRAGRMDHLTTFWNSAGWCDERTHVFLARDLEEADPPDGFVAEAEEAHMEIVRLPLAAVVEAVAAGEITDAKTIVGILLAARHA